MKHHPAASPSQPASSLYASDRATVSAATARWSTARPGPSTKGTTGYHVLYLTERVPHHMYVPCQVHHKGHYSTRTSTLTRWPARDGTLRGMCRPSSVRAPRCYLLRCNDGPSCLNLMPSLLGGLRGICPSYCRLPRIESQMKPVLLSPLLCLALLFVVLFLSRPVSFLYRNTEYLLTEYLSSSSFRTTTAHSLPALLSVWPSWSLSVSVSPPSCSAPPPGPSTSCNAHDGRGQMTSSYSTRVPSQASPAQAISECVRTYVLSYREWRWGQGSWQPSLLFLAQASSETFCRPFPSPFHGKTFQPYLVRPLDAPPLPLHRCIPFLTQRLPRLARAWRDERAMHTSPPSLPHTVVKSARTQLPHSWWPVHLVTGAMLLRESAVSSRECEPPTLVSSFLHTRPAMWYPDPPAEMRQHGP